MNEVNAQEVVMGREARKTAKSAMRKFGILSAMSLVVATALLGADRAANSFVTVEGEGVRVADDGSIHFPNATEPVAVEVTARPGWKVNGRKSLSLTRAPGANGTLRVTSDLGEDSGHVPLEDCQFDNVVSNAHIAPPGIKVVAPERLVLMYALPESNILVSASASCETLSNGLHEVTTTWLPCPVCHSAHDPAEEKTTEIIEPGELIWTTTSVGGSTNDSSAALYLPKGTGQEIGFSVVATNECCTNCICRAGAETTVDVYELSVQRKDYIGLNRTDKGRANPLASAKTATAQIDPGPSFTIT